MTKLNLARVAHKRSAYTARTGQATRGAKVLCRALNDQPVFLDDEDGNKIRQWTPEEVRNWRQFDVGAALSRTRVVEIAELLGELPLSAIKNAMYNGWLVKDPHARFYWVTSKAQRDLGLPAKDRLGRTLKLLDNGDRRDTRKIAEMDRELAPLLPI